MLRSILRQLQYSGLTFCLQCGGCLTFGGVKCWAQVRWLQIWAQHHTGDQANTKPAYLTIYSVLEIVGIVCVKYGKVCHV